MLNEHDVIGRIKQLLLVRLELEDTGLTEDQIGDDHLLLDEAGLGLDSVEALDLLVGIEKTYGIQIPEINKDLIETACRSVRSLAQYVVTTVGDVRLAA
jgi:acyl carrier protein